MVSSRVCASRPWESKTSHVSKIKGYEILMHKPDILLSSVIWQFMRHWEFLLLSFWKKKKVAFVTNLHTSAKSQKQVLKVGSHITSRKKQRDINVFVLELSLISPLTQSRIPNQWTVLPVFRLDLPTAARAKKTISHRLAHGLPRSILSFLSFSYQLLPGCFVTVKPLITVSPKTDWILGKVYLTWFRT